MKTRSLYNKAAMTLLVGIGLTSMVGCSDDFLAEKQPYGSYGPDLVYGDWSSVKLRLNYIYQRSLPYSKGWSDNVDNYYPDIWPRGMPDHLSSNTEEFVKQGRYMDSTTVWSNTNVDKYFWYGVNESPWKKIRECNDVITRINESTSLSDQEKAWGDAQARFFRASRYYRLWKRYGGVPIVSTLQSTIVGDTLLSRVTRNSTDDTFRFMIDDLTFVGENLPTRWDEEANDWGRITAGTGYALAGIIANYYASPVFNRADDTDRWQEAYELNQKAIEKLNEGGFGLAYEGNPGTNASNWAKIWTNVLGGDGSVSEAVYIEICNNVSEDDHIHNAWEQSIRPGNCKGDNSRSDNLSTREMEPTAEMVDLFPMADGKRPTETGTYTYNSRLFFLNRDPRFYRTFAFPGEEWRFVGSIDASEADSYPYLSGSEYKLYNFAWYADAEAASDNLQSGYFTDRMGSGGKTIYIRKQSQDAAIAESQLYTFENDGGFELNGAPLIAIRYTEVLLNLAEAACGINQLDEAYQILQRIRQRVGYTGDCGLDPAIRGDRAKMFEAILYERQVELAYEGKRFDDCHRWMLFDGGVGQEALNAGWGLTGFGGNTCTYLGVTPINNILKHRLEIYFDPNVYSAARSSENDPFLTDSLQKPTALTLTEDMTATLTEDSEGSVSYTYANANVGALAQFYLANTLRKDVVTMTNSEGEAPGMWDPKMYFMGLNTADQSNNPNVVQTIGWEDRYGTTGVFDPLSLTPITER